MKPSSLLLLSLLISSIFLALSFFILRPKIKFPTSSRSATEQITSALPSGYSFISQTQLSFRQIQIYIKGPSSSQIQVILDTTDLPHQIQILQKLLKQPKIESVTFLNLASKPPYGHRQDN